MELAQLVTWRTIQCQQRPHSGSGSGDGRVAVTEIKEHQAAEALKQNEGGATALTATAESKHGEWWQVELKTRDPRQPRIPGDQQRWSHRNLQSTDEWPKWSCGSALAVGMASWRVGTGQSAGPM